MPDPVISSSDTSPRAPRTPSLADLLKRAIDYTLEDVHVMLPGKVASYDAATQKANVDLLVKRRIALDNGQELTETFPQLPNVPIVFPRGGGVPGFFVSFPIQVGDFVMVMFAERSIDAWLFSSGGVTDPNDFRKHDLSDAVAIPGLYPFSKALPDAHAANMAMGASGGGQVHFDGVNVHLGSFPATDFVALATATEARLAAIETWGAAHTHVCAAPSSPSGPPVPPLAPGAPVASTIAKAT